MATDLTDIEIDNPNETGILSEWIQSLIDDGTFTPGNAMVIGDNMASEAALLVKNGYRVTLVDPTGDGLDMAKQQNVPLTWAAKMNFMDIKPWYVGHLDLILDRNTLENLPPRDRFAYANCMGRLLAGGSWLAGVYRIGTGKETRAPYSLKENAFRRMLCRYFQPEGLEELPSTTVSAAGKYLGLLQRRFTPRKVQRARY